MTTTKRHNVNNIEECYWLQKNKKTKEKNQLHVHRCLIYFYATLRAKQRLIIKKPNFSCWRQNIPKTQNSSLRIFAVGSFIPTQFFTFLSTKQSKIK